MSSWELLEFEASRLYAVFIGAADELSAAHEYGKGNIFRDRVSLLRRASDKFFISHPDQASEGQFQLIVAHMLGYADRRNEIAHGVVFMINQLDFIRQRLLKTPPEVEQWALIPPHHTIGKHTPDGIPKYVYAQRQIIWLSIKVGELNYHVADLRHALTPPALRVPLRPRTRQPQPLRYTALTRSDPQEP